MRYATYMGHAKKAHIPRWIRWLMPAVLIAIWLIAAAVGGPYFGKISEVADTDLATFLPESAESTKVNEVLYQFRDNKTVPALIVFDKDGQELSPAQIAELGRVRAAIQKSPGVRGSLPPPIPSKDGKAALVIVPIESNADFESVIPALKQTVSRTGVALDYKVGGAASFAHDLQGAFADIDSRLLIVALSAVFIILLIVYRSPLLPFVVLMVAVTALAAAILLVYKLAQADIVELNGQVQGILFILVIGAATDYSLLYIARYREELYRWSTAWEATKAAWKASYEPILAAGGTVVVGLLCLLFSDLRSNQALGPVGGIGMLLSVTAALTFLPAVLLLLGRASFWPRRPHQTVAASDVSASEDYERQHTAWKRVGSLVRRRPRRLWVVSSALLLLCCVGVVQLKAEGVSQNNLVLGYSEAREAQHVIDRHFPAGSGSPTYVLTPRESLPQMLGMLMKSDGVAEASPLVDEQKSAQLGRFAPKTVEGNALVQVILDEPADSIAAREEIKSLRKAVKAVNSNALVGGSSAVQLDTNVAATRDQKVVIPLILVAITIILMLLLRSIVAPLVLLGTTLVSFGATLGVSALLFNYVWDFPGADPSVLLFGFVFLVALGIDYNIFLMTRVREETLRLGISKGTIKGLVVTGGVITSAGIVLAATFAALGVIPILFLAQIAFIVAFGVLLDTAIVRSLLVPALTLEIGKHMWWPSRKRNIRA